MKAIEHYREAIRSLKARNLKPMLTLHHFTNPLWLTGKGGWEHPEVVHLFDRNTRFVAEKLGRDVELWITINEPVVYAYLGYLDGSRPPDKRDFNRTMRVIKHMLLAHGRVFHTIHSLLGKSCAVGIAKHCRIMDPFNRNSPADTLISYAFDYMFNRLFVKACLTGIIPPPAASFQSISRLKNTLDFIGVNYYSSELVKFDPGRPDSLYSILTTKPGSAVNSRGWEIYPYGLYRILLRLKKHKKPIYITENGIATDEDTQRSHYIMDHLTQVHRAISRGIDIRGYFYWTFMDNFEWDEGYRARFGLMHVDFNTRKRTLRPSGKLFAEIAKQGAITEEIRKMLLSKTGRL
jgi:beta-glucosidase